MKSFLLTCLLFIFLFKTFLGGEKDLIQNSHILTASIKSEAVSLSRKDLLLRIKQPKLSVLLDLKAGQLNDFYQLIPTISENLPLYNYLDKILKDSGLYYHTEGNTLFIGSEWSWLTKEEIYQNEYDITNIYNEKEELKSLITNMLTPFDIVKCRYEINFINSKQCAIIGNKFIHFYLNKFFTKVRKPIIDYSDISNQLIFPAEFYFKKKTLNVLPSTLSAEEWLILIGQLNSENVLFNNEHIRENLKKKSIKIEKENEQISVLLNLIKTQTNENILYQKDSGIFFNPDNMLKMVPIQRVQFRIYNIKQFTDKLNGSFICQNIKDEIKKDIWIYPENQIIYYKHLEEIIVIAPPQIFPEIDTFFHQLKQKYK